MTVSPSINHTAKTFHLPKRKVTPKRGSTLLESREYLNSSPDGNLRKRSLTPTKNKELTSFDTAFNPIAQIV